MTPNVHTDFENHRCTQKVALIQGASRGIGLAMTRALLEKSEYGRVFATCRRPARAAALRALSKQFDRLTVLELDLLDLSGIAASADIVEKDAGRLDLIVNCSGVLHDDSGLQPEKRLVEVDSYKVERSFRINTVGSLLVAREFERLLRSGESARFVALSARVGSIGDNRSGGWYAYRTSKAALNMAIKTLSIEWSRLAQPISCYSIHPGTVATELSRPFRDNLKSHRVFEPDEAAENILKIIHALTPQHTGGFYAWDGTPIEW